MTVPETDLEAEGVRLFAAHGLASNRVQLLERRLADLLATAFGPDTPALLPAEEYKALAHSYASGNTFGGLVKLLEKHPAATEEPMRGLIEDLWRRVDDRNYLVHRFFWAHAEDIVDKERREFLVGELRQMAERFKESNERLRDIYMRWVEKSMGIPRHRAEAIFAAMRAAVKIT